MLVGTPLTLHIIMIARYEAKAAIIEFNAGTPQVMQAPAAEPMPQAINATTFHLLYCVPNPNR